MSNIPIIIPVLANSPNEKQLPKTQDRKNKKAPFKISETTRYMECTKNHAVALGSNAFGTDGCGEFLAGGEDGTIEAFSCAACKCHRNYHRKIIVEPCTNTQCCDPTSVEDVAKKRFRTKFTQEQKGKMHEFAEKSKWKIKNLDDAEVNQFCEEIGIQRNVLKVWMHNNKYHPSDKKASSSSTV